MYQWQQWQDHVTEHENRYREINNSDGTVTHEAVEGEIIQQGTPQSATNFNHMEDGISNAGELAALLVTEILHQRQKTEEETVSNTEELAALLATEAIHQRQAVADLMGETVIVQLTNDHQYPFNNSMKTIALKTPRNHLNYTVTAEVMEYDGGCIGDIEISEKLVNGFKVEYTGSAKSVTVKLFVKGGFY